MRYLAILTAFFLSGCALLTQQPEFSCPKTGLIAEASTITFPAPGAPRPEIIPGASAPGTGTDEVIAQAAITGFSGGCSYKKPGSVQAEMTLPFIANRGANWPDLKDVKLTYFIAVLSPEEEILQRQAFSITIPFDKTGMGSTVEEHGIDIPMKTPADAHKYKIVIGFALTPDQLRYNRERK